MPRGGSCGPSWAGWWGEAITFLAVLGCCLGCRRDEEESCAKGSEGCSCYSGDTCDEGLLCRSELCVRSADAVGGGGGAESENPGGPMGLEILRSSEAYQTEVTVPAADSDALRAGARAFSLDLYREVAARAGADENLFLGTHSVASVLAMTSAGARGATEAELAAVLQHGLTRDALHPAMNQLGQDLRAEFANTAVTYRPLNSLWLANDRQVAVPFLDVLSRHYDAGIYLVDFEGDAEGARGSINDWVAEQTQGLIPELFAPGTIDETVELALTNAAYLSAPWRDRFLVDSTRAGEFALADGDVVDAQIMDALHRTPFVIDVDWGAAELPFRDANASMILVLPNEGEFSALEASLDAPLIERIVAGLEVAAGDEEIVRLAIPKFEFTSSVDLHPALAELGAASVFVPGGADFSGIDPEGTPYVQSFLHQATVGVDEEGTTAAVATGAAQGWGSIPPYLAFTRPFLFFVYDHGTGTVLFVGRLVRPAGEARAPTNAP